MASAFDAVPPVVWMLPRLVTVTGPMVGTLPVFEWVARMPPKTDWMLPVLETVLERPEMELAVAMMP